MTDEELERTEQMKTMIIESDFDEDDSIIEDIEEFLEKLDYLDISDEKKESLKEMCEKIKAEEDENVREYLFNLLQKEID